MRLSLIPTPRTQAPDPAWWGLETRDGRLFLDDTDLTGLADRFGTPLHVASAARLRATAAELVGAFAGYEGGARAHYSYKTNLVAGILRVLHDQGLGAEVVSGYELWLARRLGVPPDDIVMNGPNKTDDELRVAISEDIGLLVVDHLDELGRVERIAAELGSVARIGLRLCPDVVPRRMNASSLTGSRRNQFGLDGPAGEVEQALRRAVASPRLRLRGLMAHIGSGIHDLEAFRAAVDRLLAAQARAFAMGAAPDLLDVGGGLGTRLSREFTTLEMLAYLGMGRLPGLGAPGAPGLTARYAEVVCDAVTSGCTRLGLPLPRLVLEPGRAVTSAAQVLLLRVGAVRERPGVGRFALTDGGAMTVSMMFLSEVHAVLLATRQGDDLAPVSVFGALPSPMDVVYRNLVLPALRRGDVLAVMDAGAYFTSTSTRFGGPRPGVVLLDGGAARWVRRPETFEDLAALELDSGPQPKRTDS